MKEENARWTENGAREGGERRIEGKDVDNLSVRERADQQTSCILVHGELLAVGRNDRRRRRERRAGKLQAIEPLELAGPPADGRARLARSGERQLPSVAAAAGPGFGGAKD